MRVGWAGALVVMLGLYPATAAAQPPADPDATELQVSPNEVPPGGSVDISGEGCDRAEVVRIQFWNPEPLSEGSVVAGVGGDFGATVQIPPEARPGRAWLRATCDGPDGETVASDATLLVTRPPLTITWVNLIFGVGAALVVAGIGLEARRGRRSPSRGGRRRGRRRRRAR